MKSIYKIGTYLDYMLGAQDRRPHLVLFHFAAHHRPIRRDLQLDPPIPLANLGM